MVHPLAALIGLLVGLAVIGISRYVSLGSIIGVSVGVLAVVVFAFLHQVPFGFLPWGLGMGLLIIGIHRDNIERLLKGTERKIGQRA
jgi:glycerol-3-phosphate acyltransferase PlsY